MDSNSTIAKQIQENANGIKSASGDQGSVTKYSVQEQIAAAEYCAKATAGSTKTSMRGVVRSLFAFRVGPPDGRGL